MSGPSFHFRWPPSWYFKFPPAVEPLTLPPPSDGRSFAAPFEIPRGFYHASLDWRVPVTIALLYSTTVAFLNKYNRDNGNQPWRISKTRAFNIFVLAHNVLLAVFSAITCWGMLRALAHTWPAHREYPLLYKSWPGLRTQNGLAGAADALCHINGPRGFGDAVYYSPEAHQWVSKNRLWNEGLAFYGFWFYLSKFYEVLDTAIILAKGKRSQTLQTYHHAGAMMCMWAGIRFMSPPIWMFVFINSFIHALMYTYYTLSALGVRVPQRIKRTLTTMQILQFVVGFTFAAGHLFVEYSVPVAMPYRITSTLSSAASAATSVVSSAVSEATSVTAVGQLAGWLKKVAFRAAGEEGLAENVRDDSGHAFGQGADIVEHIHEIREETKYRTEYQTIPCIDTQGQAFAIYLNLLYLAPLTWLFVRFFIRAYTRRGAANKNQPRRRRISKSAHDAAHGVERELEGLGKALEDSIGDVKDSIRSSSHDGTSETSNTKSNDRRRVSHAIGHIVKSFESSTEDLGTTTPNGSAKGGSLRKKASEEHEKLRRMFESGEVRSGSHGSQSPDGTRRPRPSTSSSIREEVQSYGDAAVEKLEDAATAAVQQAKRAVGSGSAIVDDDADETDGESRSLVGEVTEKASEAADDAKKQQHEHKQEQEASNGVEQANHEQQPEQESEPDAASAAEEDHHEHQSEQEPKPEAASGAEEKHQEEQHHQQQQDPDSRASSPTLSRQSTQQRDTSPQKPSRIPRATSRPRSTSPTKKSLTPQQQQQQQQQPQSNGTASSSRSRTPEPIPESPGEHEAESAPQVRPPSPNGRDSSPVKTEAAAADTRNASANANANGSGNLARKIEKGEEPGFARVLKGGPVGAPEETDARNGASVQA